MDPADEPPSILWGLDPTFSAFARLYVGDVLRMVESTQVPGIFFYNMHPIYKVDVFGTVVYKKEREDFFCYGVDDGTGVIKCLCWKNNLLKEDEGPNTWQKCSHGAQGSFRPVAELEKLRQNQKSRCCVEIGELLRVRGPVKTSRQQREIMASTYYKVNDPVMAVRIAWMMEVLELYNQCYRKHLQLQTVSIGDSAISSVCKATSIMKDFLKEEMVTKFRPYDVQDLLQPLISSHPQTATENQEQLKVLSSCQELRQLMKETLQVLQDEGMVYCKVKSKDEVYHVTVHDEELFIAIKDIIREDSKREKYAEKGCHILHILSAVRQRYSLNVTRTALELVLKLLECDSDIRISCLHQTLSSASSFLTPTTFMSSFTTSMNFHFGPPVRLLPGNSILSVVLRGIKRRVVRLKNIVYLNRISC
ncbi:CST complex subunit STN1 isoform X2 [Antennarius striatus]|uniref:CST complex subunit STN1 isoform X2 n=1 Tax=Antennarius striatus TaxID=241820 RepID=UPI0035B151B3